MNIKFISILLILFISFFGCSSNKLVVKDYRKDIINAEIWNHEYISNDSTTGIQLNFVSTILKESQSVYWQAIPQGYHKLERINVSFWKYPLDTVVQKKVIKDYMFSLPSTEIVDLATINYEIKNTPIEINLEIDSSKVPVINIPPGEYLMLCRPFSYESKWIKDINVKQNYCSVIKVDTIPSIIHVY